MNQIFLGKLYGALEGATVRELQGLHDFFGKYHVWDWVSAEHTKTLFWLRSQPDGEYNAKQISAAISVVGPKGQLWPEPVMIPRIISGLNQLKLVRVTWAKTGLREIQPFHLELNALRGETGGPLWDRFGEVILSASYKEISALAQLYSQTDLMNQPGFYLPTLCWLGSAPADRVKFSEFQEKSEEIKRQVRSSHDMRNVTNGIWWAFQKKLIFIEQGIDDFRLDTSPLCSLGFETNQTNKGGKHEQIQ